METHSSRMARRSWCRSRPAFFKHMGYTISLLITGASCGFGVLYLDTPPSSSEDHASPFLQPAVVQEIQKFFRELYISKKQTLDNRLIAFLETHDPQELLDQLGMDVQEFSPTQLSSYSENIDDTQEDFFFLPENEHESLSDLNHNIAPTPYVAKNQPLEKNLQSLQLLIDYRALQKKLACCRQQIKFFEKFPNILENLACAVKKAPHSFQFMDWEIFKRDFYTQKFHHLPFQTSYVSTQDFSLLKHFLSKQLHRQYVLGFEDLSTTQQQKYSSLIVNIIQTVKKALPRFLGRLVVGEEFVRSVQSQACVDFLRAKLSDEKRQYARQITDHFLPPFLTTMKTIQEEALKKERRPSVLDTTDDIKEGLLDLKEKLTS